MSNITTLFLLTLSVIATAHAEGDFLGEGRQLTFPNQFAKAGEAYFSPHEDKIVFQAVARVGEGQTEDPFYAMFVADLVESGSEIKLENI